jgi:hypothetical protein
MHPSGEHVVVESRTLRGICQHCGRTFQCKLPCELDVWLAAAEAFGRSHRDCPPLSKAQHGDEEMLANISEDALE